MTGMEQGNFSSNPYVGGGSQQGYFQNNSEMLNLGQNVLQYTSAIPQQSSYGASFGGNQAQQATAQNNPGATYLGQQVLQTVATTAPQSNYGNAWLSGQTAYQAQTNTQPQAAVQNTGSIVKPMGSQNMYPQQEVKTAYLYQQNQPQIQQYNPPIVPLPATPTVQVVQPSIDTEKLTSLTYAAGQAAQKNTEELKQLHMIIDSLNQKISNLTEEQKKLYAQTQAQINLQQQQHLAAPAPVAAPIPFPVQHYQSAPQGGVNFLTGMSGMTISGFDMAGQLPVSGQLQSSGRQQVSGQVQASGTLQLTGFIETSGTMDTHGTLTTQGQVQAIPQVQNFEVQMPRQQFQMMAPQFQGAAPQMGIQQSQIPTHSLQDWMINTAQQQPQTQFQPQPQRQEAFYDTTRQPPNTQNNFTNLLAADAQEPPRVYIPPEPATQQTSVSQGPNVDELVNIMRNMSKKIEGLEQNIAKNKIQKNVTFNETKSPQANIDDQSFTTSLHNAIGNYITKPMTDAETFDEKPQQSNQNSQSTKNSINQNSQSRQNIQNNQRNRVQSRREPDYEEEDGDEYYEESPRPEYTYTRVRSKPRRVAVPAYRPAPVVIREEPVIIQEEPIYVAPPRRTRVSYVPMEKVVTEMVPVEEDYDYVSRPAQTQIRGYRDYFPVQVGSSDYLRGSSYSSYSQPSLDRRYVSGSIPSSRNSIFGDRGTTYYPTVRGDNVSYAPTRSATAQFFNQPSTYNYPAGGDSFKTNNGTAYNQTAKPATPFSMNTTQGSNTNAPKDYSEEEMLRLIREQIGKNNV